MKRKLAVAVIGAGLIVGLAACEEGSGSIGGDRLPVQTPGEDYRHSPALLAGVVVLEGSGCWTIDLGDGPRLVVFPAGYAKPQGDGTVMQGPDGFTVDSGMTVNAIGGVVPAAGFPGVPDGYWGNYLAFCDPPVEEFVVLDTLEPPDTSTPPVTATVTDFQANSLQLPSPPSQVLEDLEAALHRSSIWMLLPSDTPQGTTSESFSVDVSLSHTMPGGGPGGDIVVRRGDLSVYVNVETLPADEESICRPLLDDTSYPAWSTRIVRDVTGCSLMVEEAVSYIAWTEDGQDFIAQFGPETDVDALISWLGTWKVLGSA